MSTANEPETSGDVAAIMACIAHKMAVEQGAEIVRVPGAVGLRYRAPLFHPWPRAVELSVEILAEDFAAGARARAQILVDPDETHRLGVIGCEVATDAAEIEAAGYDGCWNTSLLAASLDQAPRSTAAGLQIERVVLPGQVAELNALAAPEFPSSRADALRRPEFLDLLGRRKGRAVAKGQVSGLAGETVYVADMFTDPAARKTGYARAQSCRRCMTRRRPRGPKRAVCSSHPWRPAESGFYEKRGYRPTCWRAVLLSKVR